MKPSITEAILISIDKRHVLIGTHARVTIGNHLILLLRYLLYLLFILSWLSFFHATRRLIIIFFLFVIMLINIPK